MRNYTSPTQKSEIYSVKYNLPQKVVFDILTKSEDLLTFDELKIKYDNPNMGQLPEWLSEKELDLIIWKSIHTVYNKNYSKWSTWITKEDLYMELHIWVRKISHLLDSYKTLKVSCINHMKFLLQNQMVSQNYVSYCLDNKICNDEDKPNEKTIKDITSEPTSLQGMECIEFLSSIDSIKNKEVRNLLIVIGYLYSNITELRGRYLNILRNSDEDTKQGLHKLEQQLEHNDEIYRMRIDGFKPKEKVKKIKVQDIVKVMCNLEGMEELPEGIKLKVKNNKETAVKVKPEDVYINNLQYYLLNAKGL